MEKFALIIAVENYLDPIITPVKHAENDARQFAKALELHCYERSNMQVLLSSTATKTTIQSHLTRILSHANEEAYVIIFYAGHGFAENDHNYLTCSDTIKADLVRTSISLQSIFLTSRRSRCKHIILFLDCCHSGFEIDESMRGILSEITDDQFKKFFEDSEYHLGFASCRTDEYSYSSTTLEHGIWTYHIIEAFMGNVIEALERKRFLTADSLQTYLSREVPRTVRKAFTGTRVQTPRVFGNYSKGFVLADFKEIFEKRAANLRPKLAQLKRVFFSGSTSGRVKSLSGFRKHHRVPDSVNPATENFLARIGRQEVEDYANDIFNELRSSFGYRRQEIDLSIDAASASILTKDFTVIIQLALNPQDTSEYLLTTEVTEIQNPGCLNTDAFNSVFSEAFNALTFQFDKKFDVESLIDAIEAINNKDLISVDYPGDVSSCTIRMKEYDASITVTSHDFRIEHASPVQPKKLIESFHNAQKLLVSAHDIKLLPLHS